MLALSAVLLLTVGCNEPQQVAVQNPVPTTTETQIVGNIFDLSTAKVGDKVGTMNITSMKPFGGKNEPIDNTNCSVSFSGMATVFGTYEPVENLSMIPLASFTLDEASMKMLPALADDKYNFNWFELNNPDAEVIAKLGKVKKTATIVIKNYTLVRYPSEVSSTADLVDVTVPSSQK